MVFINIMKKKVVHFIHGLNTGGAETLVMDVFVFPSKYEGLGIVLIEAQKSGLPCFASDIIPVYAKVTNLVNFYSLNIDEKEWAKEILKFRNMEYRNEFIKQSGEVPSEWEMKNVINKLEQIYEGVI